MNLDENDRFLEDCVVQRRSFVLRERCSQPTECSALVAKQYSLKGPIQTARKTTDYDVDCVKLMYCDRFSLMVTDEISFTRY